MTSHDRPDADPSPAPAAGATRRRRRAWVRPRVVWVAVAVSLAGSVAIGLGIVTTSLPLSLAGVLVLVAGIGLGWWGGGQYDVHTGGASGELAEVEHGEQHAGVVPGDMVGDRRVRAHARGVERRRARVLEGSHHAPGGQLAGLGAIVALATSVAVPVVAWQVNTPGRTGHHSGLWAYGLCGVAFLAAVRVLVGRPGRHPVAAVLMAAAGVVLVVGGGLVTARDPAVVVYVVGGAVVAACAAACLLSPERTPAPGAAARASSRARAAPPRPP